MAIGTKRNADFGIGPQTTAGTAAASPAFYIPVKSANIEPAIVQHEPETIGARQQISSARLGADYTWSAEWDLHISTGRFFEWAFGAVSTGAGPPYDHECTPATTFDPDTGFWTVFIDREITHQGAATQVMRLIDACVNSWTIEIAPRQAVTISADGMGSKIDYATSVSGTYPSTDPFIWDDLTFKIDDYGGTPVSEVDCEKVTITFENNFDYSRFRAGDNFPQPGVAGGVMAKIAIETTAQDDPFFWQDVMAGTNKAIIVELSKTVGGNVYEHFFSMLFASPSAATPSEIGGGNDRPVFSAEFTGLYDLTNHALKGDIQDQSTWA